MRRPWPGCFRRSHLQTLGSGRGVETCALRQGSLSALRPRCACAAAGGRHRWVEVSAQPVGGSGRRLGLFPLPARPPASQKGRAGFTALRCCSGETTRMPTSSPVHPQGSVCSQSR